MIFVKSWTGLEALLMVRLCFLYSRHITRVFRTIWLGPYQGELLPIEYVHSRVGAAGMHWSPEARIPAPGQWLSGSAACAQSRLTLCDPTDCSPPGSSVHGILQARILEWVAMPFSRGSSHPRDWTQVSCIVGRFLTTEPAVSCL